MSRDILTEYEPPREIIALGAPIQVFARSRAATDRLWGGVRGFGFLMVLLSSMTLGLFFMTAPAKDRESTPTVVAACVVGGLFFLGGAFLIVVPVKPWPAYAYALYPRALAYLNDGTWSVVRWDDVERWRDPSLRSFWPALVLQDGGEVVLRNDFFFPTFLYGAVQEQLRIAEFHRDSGTKPEPSTLPTYACPAAAQSGRRLSPGQIRGQRRFAAGLLVVGLALLIFNARWIIAAAEGPVAITTAQLSAAGLEVSALPSPWVTIELDEVWETGLRVMESCSGQREAKAKSRYLVARARDRWMIVEVPIDHSSRTVTGYLGGWWTPFSKKAVHIIETTRMPPGAGSLLPYQLDGAYQVRTQCASMVAIAAFCLLAGIFILSTVRSAKSAACA